MINQFMGYTVYRVAEFRPSTILFTRENETITVSMLQEALEYMISAIIKKKTKNPIFERYGVALKVLQAIQMRLSNRQTQRPSKKDFKIACDVLSEIQKENAMTEAQKDRIDAAAFQCKLFIECSMQG